MKHRADDSEDIEKDSRQKVAYRWHDPDTGPGVAPAIELTVRFDPDLEQGELILYELTKGWMAICRSVRGEQIKA